LLVNIQEQTKNKRHANTEKKELILLKKVSMRGRQSVKPEQKVEQKMILLTAKVNNLTRIVEEQSKIIHEMRNDLKTSIGLPKVEMNP